MERARKLISYKRMSPDVKALYKSYYPEGYGDEDIQKVHKSGDETLFVVPLEASDATYLIKVDIFKKKKKLKLKGMDETYNPSDSDENFFDDDSNYLEVN